MYYSIAIFIIAYLVGAISPSILISNKVLKTDIREIGSGNAGTTNVYRTMGLGWAIVVFILDILKVVLAWGISMLIMKIFNQNEVQTYSACMSGVLIGHCYPIYYNFKGGKGVATMIMALILLDPKIAGICITTGLVVLLVTQTVSKASLSGAIMFPIVVFFMKNEYFFLALFIALFIIFKHRENIKRIMNGSESKTFGKK